MTEIKEITKYEDKVRVVEKIIADLPEWFGKGVKISDIEKVSGSFKNMLVFAAYENHDAVGFISIKRPTPNAAEIGDLGVLLSMHGHGIGKKLVAYSEEYCRKNGIDFLTVKTIDESSSNNSYKGTRAFYKALKFKPIDVLPTLWGEGFPCLYLIKCITGAFSKQQHCGSAG